VSTNVPKPEAFRRRRNAIPASKAVRRLPLDGRPGLAPTPSAPLFTEGMRWWTWAWSTPQATTWTHNGFTESLLKRAQLEDQWLTAEPWEKLKLLPLMARLDEQFGLTPRSAAQLHLTFEEPPEPEVELTPVADVRDRLKGLG
jgi:hypothetical protein